MKKLIIALTALISLSSCKKNLIEKYEAMDQSNQASVQQFKDLKTDANFDWKTSKAIAFKFEGYPTISEINTTLLITSEDGKVVFYQGLVSLSSQLSLPLEIPTHIKSLKVSYGAIQKTFSTNAPTLVFNCLPEPEAE